MERSGDPRGRKLFDQAPLIEEKRFEQNAVQQIFWAADALIAAGLYDVAHQAPRIAPEVIALASAAPVPEPIQPSGPDTGPGDAGGP